MFTRHRGDEVLKTIVDTYEKPQVRTGRAGVEMFDNSYEFKDVRIDGVPVSDISVMSGGMEGPGGWYVGAGGQPVEPCIVRRLYELRL